MPLSLEDGTRRAGAHQGRRQPLHRHRHRRPRRRPLLPAAKVEDLAADPTDAALQAEVAETTEDLAVESQNFAGGLSEFEDDTADAFRACQTQLGGLSE